MTFVFQLSNNSENCQSGLDYVIKKKEKSNAYFLNQVEKYNFLSNFLKI